MIRPFCVCVASYMLSAFLTLRFSYFSSRIVITSLFVLFFIFLFLAFITKKSTFAFISIAIIFSLIAIFKTSLVDLKKINTAQELDGKYIVAEGRAESVTATSDYLIINVSCKKVNLVDTNLNTTVITRKTDGVDIGSIIQFRGEAEFSADSTNKGDESFLTVFPSYFDAKPPSRGLSSFFFELRGAIRNKVSSAGSASLLKALIIGDKNDLPKDVKDDFRKLGLSHILAISGLHLSILVMSIYLTLQRLDISRYITISVSICITIFYIALTGFSYSVLRAGGMMIIYFLTRLMRRTSDSITALFFAVFIIVLGSSWSLYSLSLELSFLSTLGILVFLPPAVRAYENYFRKRNGVPGKIKRAFIKLGENILISLFSTFSATLFTLPVILINFNEVSLISPLSNLFIVFISKYYLISGCVGTLLRFFGIPSMLAFFIPDLISRAMLFLVKIFVLISPPFAGMDMGFVKIGAIAIFVIVIISLPFCRSFYAVPITVLSVTIFFLAFNLCVSRITFDHLRASAVWKIGCNTVLLSNEDNTTLIDMTLTDSTRVSDVLTLLSERRIEKVDNAIFVINRKVPENRIKLLIELSDAKSVILVVPSDFEDDFIPVYYFCKDNGIDFELSFATQYFPTKNAEIINLDESLILKLENDVECILFTRVFGEDPYIPYFENCKVLFTDTKYLPYDAEYTFLRGDLPLSFWRINDESIIRE